LLIKRVRTLFPEPFKVLLMKKILVFIMLAAMLTACGPTVRVISDYDQTVEFDQYSTFGFYGWSEESDQMLSRFEKQRVEQAVKEEFERRGISQVDIYSEPDLIVALIAVVEERTERRVFTEYERPGFRYFGYHYGYGPGYPWGPGYAVRTVREFDYQVGTLVIDVFDTSQQVLVWEGAGSQVIDQRPERRDRGIPRAVSEIMEEFPVDPRD
jgi:hypothetical protein